jgi:hypothetical protein
MRSTRDFRKTSGLRQNDIVPAAGCHGAAGAVITEAACPTLGLAAGGSVTVANANIAAMLSLYPNPNNGANSYLFGPSTKVGVNYGQVRFDQCFSSSDSFFAPSSERNARQRSYSSG